MHRDPGSRLEVPSLAGSGDGWPCVSRDDPGCQYMEVIKVEVATRYEEHSFHPPPGLKMAGPKPG